MNESKPKIKKADRQPQNEQRRHEIALLRILAQKHPTEFWELVSSLTKLIDKPHPMI